MEATTSWWPRSNSATAVRAPCSAYEKKKSVTFLLNLKALLGVLLPLLGQDDHVLPDGGELLLEQLDHSGLLPQILQLL